MYSKIVVLITALLLAVIAAPANAASAKVQLGIAQSNGSSLNLALTTKFKNKVAVIEYGTKSGKKFKFTKLATARIDARGNAQVCTTKKLAATGKIQVKIGSKVIASTNVSSRTRIAGCPISAPGNLALTSASDSGVSSSDAITNATEIAITGNALAGSTISVRVDGAVSSSCVASSLGIFTCALPNSMAEGTYAITSVATLGRSVSLSSAVLNMVIDRTAPTMALSWLENEIGLGATVHLDCNPNEPIAGFSSSDIEVPATIGGDDLEFMAAQVTQSGYRVAIDANTYNTTNLILFLRDNSFTDLAGNSYVATTYSNYLGRRITPTPYLDLDIYGPRVTSAIVEELTEPITYSRLTFSFDEPLLHADINDFSIYYYQSFMGGIAHQNTVPLTTLSSNGVLYTNDNQTFWVNMDAVEYFYLSSYANAYQLAAINFGNTDITDDYGNPADSGNEAQIGDWAY